MPGSFVKLQFEEGEIDFVAAPNLTDAAPFFMRHREQFLEQIRQPGAGFMASFEAIAATGYRPSLALCIQVATAYLSAPKEH